VVLRAVATRTEELLHGRLAASVILNVDRERDDVTLPASTSAPDFQAVSRPGRHRAQDNPIDPKASSAGSSGGLFGRQPQVAVREHLATCARLGECVACMGDEHGVILACLLTPVLRKQRSVD
jgi:hypothetical protein